MTAVRRIGAQSDPRVGQSLTVVHLSDLHFGPSHRFERQTTAGGDRVADGQTLLDSLKADLASVLSEQTPETSAPVLIVVTGDLTDTAAPEQFREAATFILGLEEFLGDWAAHTVIVPGNHDVRWEETDIDDRLSAWRGFARDRLHRNVVGLPDHPFALVYDDHAASHGTIVAAINSAGFVERGKPDENRGRISPNGIADLDQQLRSLPDDDTWLRVALVHHHPILIPDLVEAGRGYDAIVDGGDLLKVLRRHGFHLILHGHKHLPFNFSEDSRAAYSTRQTREQRPILVVCGGSVGSSEVSDRMQTPTNYYNILRIKWLPRSGQCRSRIEPRQLVRYESGTTLPRGEWHWEPCLPDDRCYEPPPAEGDDVPPQGETVSFADSSTDDAPRVGAYESNRGAFPVVEIRPSLVPSQAHEANVWIEHHPFENGAPDERLVKVVWSAGPKHEVTSVSDDPSGRFDAVFTYYGPMLVMAELTFADGHQSTEFIYVPMRHVST
jgi:3',5'-cyclic AMP phosphodiesterase CpdA